MPIPFIGWAVIAVAGLFVGKKIYDSVMEDSSNSSNSPDDRIFLTGKTGVGKDTILHILKNGTFVENPNATAKLHTEIFNACGRKLLVINSAGANDNDKETFEMRKHLISNTRYTYVFNAYDYFANAETKKQVQNEIAEDKELCQKKFYTLKIIGTHKDKCLENGISEAEIQKLIDELGEEGEFWCQIWDLTRAKTQGEEVQKELCDFIRW